MKKRKRYALYWRRLQIFKKFVDATYLPLPYNSSGMKTLILLSAIPGSGKSTWAKNYKAYHDNTFIVASDEVRERVSGNVQNFEHEDLVWETFLADIHKYGKLDNVTVIADATNLQNAYRRYYYEQTPEFDRHVLVLFNIPFEICAAQNKLREPDHVVSDEGMRRLFEEFEEPTQEILDLYDEYRFIGKSFSIVK